MSGARERAREREIEKTPYRGYVWGILLFVGIGLISYSLYLWHYPFFSFAKIDAIVTEDIPKKIILILIILLMSIFSYFFIEKKFRDKSLSFKSIIKILSTFVILLLIFNFIIIFKNGFPERFENLKNINQNYNMDNLYLAKKKKELVYF